MMKGCMVEKGCKKPLTLQAVAPYAARLPNKTTTELVSCANTKGFIDYKLEPGPPSNTPVQRVEKNSTEHLQFGVYIQKKKNPHKQ